MTYCEKREGVCRALPCEMPVFEERVDVVVVGLGAAGAYCALRAAREGLQVLGVERSSGCGGVSTQGAVNGYYNGYTGGDFEQVDADAAQAVAALYRPFYNHPDAKKIRLEQALCAAGVQVRYDTVVLGVYARDRRVYGVRLWQDGTVREVGCAFLSDSTSDGYVLRMLGISGSFGRSSDGMPTPFSSVRVFRTADGRLDRTNDDSGYLNPYEDEAFARAVIRAHGRHLRDSRPENERFLYTAPQIGNREGMLIEAETTVSLADVLAQRDWPDTLLCVYSDIDKHGVDLAFDDEAFQNWFVISNLSTVAFKIRVPRSALVPKGWRGLVAVSRCLGADRHASSAIRMSRDMYRLGEAAGVALAQAVRAGAAQITDIPYAPLQERVKQLGCFDPRPQERCGFVEWSPKERFIPVTWLTEKDALAQVLDSDCPGVAIWSCYRLGNEVAEWLVQLIEQPQSIRQRDAASIALGLLGDCRAREALRDRVRRRDATFYLDCRRSNQMPGVIAVCLCGRLGDTEAVPELMRILEPAEFERPMYHQYREPDYKRSIVRGFNSVYYQYFSFAMAALRQIARQHPELAGKIGTALRRATESGDYIPRMTDDPAGGPYDRAVRSLREKAWEWAAELVPCPSAEERCLAER